MGAMNGTGYRILGYAAWHGGRWYLRQRLPSSRTMALSALSAVAALGGAAVLAKRLAS
jgi:hypothetical protein